MKASVGICAGFATTCLVRDEHVSCAIDAMRGIAINMSMGVVVFELFMCALYIRDTNATFLQQQKFNEYYSASFCKYLASSRLSP